MSIAIARRIAATLQIKSETQVRALNNALLEYVRLTPQSAVAASGAATIGDNSITMAKLADIATSRFLGRATAGTGDPEVLSVATAKTLLSLAGINTGDQTITLTGDASGQGTGNIVVTVADDSHAHTSSSISALDAGDTTTGVFDAARIPTLNQDTTGNAATADNAQLLDNLDSTDFLLANGTAANAALLDNIDSTGFLLVAGKAADSELLDGADGALYARLAGPSFTGDVEITQSNASVTTPLTLNNSPAGTGIGASGINFDRSTRNMARVEGGQESGGTFAHGDLTFSTRRSEVVAERMRITSLGRVGIGITPTAQLQLGTDSAKKPSTNTWTITSDERIKEGITPADLDRCYEIIKSLPLKRYTWQAHAYTAEQVVDRSKLGWVAQDVQKIFPKSTPASEFSYNPVDDGLEEVQEQVALDEVQTTEERIIEVINGVPTQKTTTRTETVKVPQFDAVAVVDELGEAVMVDDEPLMHQVPRMQTISRPKQRIDVIEDALSLNSDQIYAAMYGAIQQLMAKVESLEAKLAVD